MSQSMLLKSAGVALLVIAFAGCSSSDSNSSGTPSAGIEDGFVTQVKTVIATSPDNTEPRETNSITVTTPDTTSPSSIS